MKKEIRIISYENSTMRIKVRNISWFSYSSFYIFYFNPDLTILGKKGRIRNNITLKEL